MTYEEIQRQNAELNRSQKLLDQTHLFREPSKMVVQEPVRPRAYTEYAPNRVPDARYYS